MQEKWGNHECNSDALGGLEDQRKPQYETLFFQRKCNFQHLFTALM